MKLSNDPIENNQLWLVIAFAIAVLSPLPIAITWSEYKKYRTIMQETSVQDTAKRQWIRCNDVCTTGQNSCQNQCSYGSKVFQCEIDCLSLTERCVSTCDRTWKEWLARPIPSAN